MGVRAATKAFTIYQSEKVSIPLAKGEIPRLYCFLLGYSNRKRAY